MNIIDKLKELSNDLLEDAHDSETPQAMIALLNAKASLERIITKLQKAKL